VAAALCGAAPFEPSLVLRLLLLLLLLLPLLLLL